MLLRNKAMASEDTIVTETAFGEWSLFATEDQAGNNVPILRK